MNVDIQKAKDDVYIALRNLGLPVEQAEAATIAAGAKLQELSAPPPITVAAPPPIAVPDPTYAELMRDPVLLAKTDPAVVLRLQNAAFAEQRAGVR